MRRACGLQVVEQRRIAGARGPRQQLLAAREIAFRDFDHAARQLLPGAPCAVAAGGFADQAGRDDEFADRPDGDHEHDGDAEQDRDGHLDEITAKVDGNVPRVLQQKMRRERENQGRNDDDDAELHCAVSDSTRNWRISRSDSEISGAVTATMLSRISAIVACALPTCALPLSKY